VCVRATGCLVQGWSKHKPCLVQGWSKHKPCSVQGWSKHKPCLVQGWSKHKLRACVRARHRLLGSGVVSSLGGIACMCAMGTPSAVLGALPTHKRSSSGLTARSRNKRCFLRVHATRCFLQASTILLAGTVSECGGRAGAAWLRSQLPIRAAAGAPATAACASSRTALPELCGQPRTHSCSFWCVSSEGGAPKMREAHMSALRMLRSVSISR